MGYRDTGADMFVEVTEVETLRSDETAGLWRATEMTVYVTTSEASVFQGRNPKIATLLRSTTERERSRTSCRFVLLANPAQLKQMGFSDLNEQIEIEARGQAAILGSYKADARER